MTALSRDDRLLVALGAAMGSRSPEAVDRALQAATGHSSPRAVEEALVQSYLFLGYPAALNALARWREISAHPAPEATADPGPWGERGAEVCRRVYAGQYDRLRDNVRGLHPDMERWMVEEGYGKVLGRAGLPLATRELCIAALLAALDAPRQLYAHLRGALNVGATVDQVDEAVALAAAVSGEGAQARTAETWAQVRARISKER